MSLLRGPGDMLCILLSLFRGVVVAAVEPSVSDKQILAIDFCTLEGPFGLSLEGVG